MESESLPERTALRICPLCEANCGLVLEISGNTVTSVRGDKDDVFSHGFICPKGVSFGEVDSDPTRLRTPMIRNAAGTLEPASWDDAVEVIRSRLGVVIKESGPEAVGMFLGNPNVHSLSGAFMLPAFIKALGTSQRFSASTVDQMPKQAASAMMYGTALTVALADLDRTDYLLILGANPLVSNGSMLTAANFPGRLRALRKRGGQLVVVDPIRTRTAEAANEHIGIRPGSDALWLAAIAHVIMVEGTADLGAASEWIDQVAVDSVIDALAGFTPESVSAITGIDASVTRRIAAELMAAPSAAVYGRMGTTTSGLCLDGSVLPMATLTSWLIDVINIAIGSLDKPGGVMFALPAAGGPSTEGSSGIGHGVSIPGRRRTRVRELPSVLGEFPVSALAEEIDTPDPETGAHIRAVFVVGGNPIVSTPDSGRLKAAFESLDLLVSVDPYLTATNSLADVILPVSSPMTRPHYDVVFNNLSVRNQARYSPAVFPVPEGEMDEADVLLTLAGIAVGINSGHELSSTEMDDIVAANVAASAVKDTASRLHGSSVDTVLASVAPWRGVDRILDIRFRSSPAGLTLQEVIDSPHGIDLGALTPRLPEVLRTPSGRIEFAPPVLVSALAAAHAALGDSPTSVRPGTFLLVGRRQLRSNNSWMKDIKNLQGGSNKPTAQMHPLDAAEAGRVDGEMISVTSASGTLSIELAVSDTVSRGCICIPHGWADFNVNVLVGVDHIDPLGGTAVLSGLPVELEPA
ncbi:MAG: molybdopterin-dependent oxidoreductase [Actinomycetia bacterium]|nr:molybdopterin-dependent oxidoreductase [Actinomycetes bacterium]